MIAVTLVPGLTINLNLLETFLLVSQHRSFRIAGVQAGRSNSAVSSHIKQLEEQLSIPLFQRTTRSVTLTPEGRLLEEAVRRGMAEIRSGLSQVCETGPGGFRRISIACSSSLAWRTLPPIIEAYHAEAANAQIDVIESSTSQVQEALLSGEVELGIGAISDLHPDLECETLMVDPIVALIPNRFPQSGLSSITLAELSSLGMVLPLKTSLTRRLLEAEFSRLGIVPRIEHEGAGFHTLLAMVEAGLGVTAFSDLTSRHYKSASFQRVAISGLSLSMPIGVVMARNRKALRSRDVLLRIIRREAENWPLTTIG